MKIRDGFVSNSSSSSFIIIGVFCDDALAVAKKHDLSAYDGSGGYEIAEGDHGVVGIRSDGCEHCLNSAKISWINEKAAEVARALGCPLSDIELFHNEEYS